MRINLNFFTKYLHSSGPNIVSSFGIFSMITGIILFTLPAVLSSRLSQPEQILYYNFAQSLFLTGYSLFYFTREKYHHVRLASAIAAFLSLSFNFVYAYMKGWDLEFFSVTNNHINILFVFFTLSLVIFNLILYFMSKKKTTPLVNHFINIAVSFIIAFNLGIFISHSLKYLWISRMHSLASVTMCGIIILGMGIVLISFFDEKTVHDMLRYLGMIASSVSFLFITIFWNLLIFSNEDKIRDYLNTEVKHLSYMVQYEIAERFMAFDRLASHIEKKTFFSHAEFIEDSESFSEELTGFASLQIINQNTEVIYNFHAKNSENSEFNLLQKDIETAIPYATQNQTIFITKNIATQNNQNYLMIFRRLKGGVLKNSYIAAVLRVEDFMKYILSYNSHYNIYNILLIRNESILYHNGNQKSTRGSASLLNFNEPWILIIQTGPEHLSLYKSHMPLIIFTGGFLISVLIALTFWFWSNDANRISKFEAEKIKAESTNQAKTEFLSRMSHELRTPLNAILGFTQLLKLDKSLSEQQNLYLNTIRKASNHLLNLINEVLDLTKIESGKMELKIEAFLCRNLVEESVVLVQTMAAEYKIQLVWKHCEDFLYIYGDLNRTKQVLVNLLTNAIKYNKPGGEVKLSIQKVHNRVRISVKDNGVGIPYGHHTEIFQPFNRLKSTADTVEGTGIGLALSRNLITMMGGSIDFESSPGKGSHFWIDLPLASASKIHPVEFTI